MSATENDNKVAPATEQKTGISAVKVDTSNLTKYSVDPTDNCSPYGDKSYHRPEFDFIKDVHEANVASKYVAGRSSTLIYEAKINPTKLKCCHVCMTVANPFSCAYCNSSALAQYSFHRLYDDRVETNIASSCLYCVVDNTKVYYLDRDFAQKFELEGPCHPCMTHCNCGFPAMCGCGASVIGHGAVKGVCWPGSRRIASPLLYDCFYGGPFLFGFCPVGNEQWVSFRFLDDDVANQFALRLQEQRQAMVEQHKIRVGFAGLNIEEQPLIEEQSRAAV